MPADTLRGGMKLRAKKMYRVYIAGPISADNSLRFLENLRRGISVSVEALENGLAPFSPFLDFQFMLSGDNSITLKMLQEYSMQWLKVSDFIVVLPEHTRSLGTLAEIEMARELKIPVFYYTKDFNWKSMHHNTKDMGVK